MSGAPYTLLVKTRRTEPGWNLGIASHAGGIDGEVWIVESTDESKVIAKIIFSNFRGDRSSFRGDFEAFKRIQGSYLNFGKGLGEFFKSKIK